MQARPRRPAFAGRSRLLPRDRPAASPPPRYPHGRPCRHGHACRCLTCIMHTTAVNRLAQRRHMTLKVFLGAAAKPMLHIHRSMLEVMAHMEMPSSPRILDEIINGRLFTVYARVTQSRLAHRPRFWRENRASGLPKAARGILRAVEGRLHTAAIAEPLHQVPRTGRDTRDRRTRCATRSAGNRARTDAARTGRSSRSSPREHALDHSLD
jgi:hypothetical protein